MAKTTISGLTITIGADTKQFSDAIKRIDTEARNIAKDLKTVNENLKIDPSNTKKAADSLKLLQDQASKASEKVKLIKDAINKLTTEYKNGHISADDYSSSLNHLQMLLSQAKNEQDLANTKIRQFGQETKTAGQHVLTLGDLIKSNLISDAIKSGLKSIADLAKSIGTAVVNSIKSITSATKDFVMDGLNIAEENRQTLAKVGQVFGQNKQQIVDWSKKAVTAFGMTAGEAQAAAATFGNMFTALDISDEEAAKMSMDLVQLAADVGAFNNATTESVLESFQSGLAGTSRQLRQYGIVINAALIEEKALSLGLKENADDLTEGDKAIARYYLMMEQATKQQGQFARESDSATVQTQIFHARIKELKGEIGEKLIPVQARLYELVNGLLANPAIMKAFEGIVNKVDQLGQAFNKLFDDINFDDLSGTFDNIFRQLVEKLRLVLPSVLQFGGEMIKALIDGANKYLPLITANLIPLITDLFVRGVSDLPELIEGGMELIKGISAGITKGFSILSPVIDNMMRNVVQFILRNLPEITQSALDILMTLADGLIISLPVLIPAAAQMIVSICNTIADNLPEIVSKGLDIVKALAEGLGLAAGYLINGVQDLMEKGLKWILEHKEEIVEWGKKIPGYLMEGIKSMKDWFSNRLGEILSEAWETLLESFQNKDNPIYRDRARRGHEIYLQENYGWVGEAEGGPVSAGRLYRVNDDAGRRTEWFIPGQNGYILNGNQTDRIVNNNNSRNFSGGINVYVNSYGMNVAEVADELGAAIQQRVRMSGAML